MTSGAPNEEEAKLIILFRERVMDVLTTKEQESDQYLIRWIRARDNNLDKAEEMLRANLEWRSEHDLDSMLTTKLDKFYHETFPYWLEGLDKQGIPVLELPIGSWDLRKCLDSSHGGETGFFRYTNQMFERIQQSIRESNKNRPVGEYPNTVFSVVGNWDGYSYSQLWHWKAVQGILSLASRYEAYFPEIVHKIHFINCPKVFSLLFAMVKPLLAPKTVGKIVIYNKKDEWLQAMKEDFDPAELGSQFGGKAKREIAKN